MNASQYATSLQPSALFFYLSHCITLLYSPFVCYNMFMKVEITTLLSALQARLFTAEQGMQLFDTLEGYRPDARKAAVLLALFEAEHELMLTFIRRASTLRAHGGEIAFPGGSVDRSDPSLVHAALREAQEEIGLAPERVEVLGLLSPVFTVVSNYLIVPVVSFVPQGLGTLLMQESEVAEVLLMPLRALADPSIMHTEQWTRGEQTRTVYFYDYATYRIWGATGRILHELLTLLA